MIAEVAKWRRPPPFLSHEQQRCLGRQQQERHCSAIGSRLDGMMQTVPEGAIANLVVILKTVHKGRKRGRPRIGSTRPTEIGGVLAAVEPPLAHRRSDV